MKTNHLDSAPHSVDGDVSTLLAFIFEHFGKPGDAGALPNTVVLAVRRLEADIATGGLLRADRDRRDAMAKMLHAAVTAIHMDDGSDFPAALWTVVRTGDPELADLLERDSSRAFEKSGQDLAEHRVAEHPANLLQKLESDRNAWKADMTAAGAQHLGGECWEWETEDFEFRLWQQAIIRARSLCA